MKPFRSDWARTNIGLSSRALRYQF
jgi:hypothetical protein